MNEDNGWFAVRLLFESKHPEEDGVESLFEDRVVLVRAATEDEARRKAEVYGRGEEDEYKNVYEKTVVKVFTEILDVVDVTADEIKDLTEVYWQFLTPKQLKHVRTSLEPMPDSVEAAPLS
jgi:predicted nucleic acid-binding protein